MSWQMRVMVATDLGFGAGTALRWVEEHLGEADVVVVHCRSGEAGATSSLHASRNDDVRRRAEEWLLEWAPALHHHGEIVEIVHSDDLETLHKLTRLRSADLLVVGQQGVETGSPRRLGRTADRLVRHANVPVLVIPAIPAPHPSQILLGLGGDEADRHVLAWARRLAAMLEANVIAMHVIPSAAPSHLLVTASALLGEGDADAAGDRRPEEDRWRRTLVEAGLPAGRVSAEVAFGDAADELLDAARRHEAGLMVLGRNARGRIPRAILGSVVRTVLHEAVCPVLVVTEPEDSIV